MGIPYVVVNGSQTLVNINFTAYGNESDPGPMPVPKGVLRRAYGGSTIYVRILS